MQDLSRRRFIRAIGTGISSAAVAWNPLLRAAGRPRRVGVALLGLGDYSSNLLAPALMQTQHCELRGIVTGSPHKIPQWQAQFGIPDRNVYSYDTMHELANNPDIDVVYVVVPTSLHMKYSLKVAEAGKHVWCEKPMAMTVRECQAIIDACRKNRVQLSIGYRMQHEPNTRTFMGYRDRQPYGAMQHILSHAGYAGNGLPADNWRMRKAMGGGALYDMGVYPINGARFLSGLEPIAVTARHEKSHPDIFTEVDETTYFTLDMPGGVSVTGGTSVVKSFNKLRVECERGWYQLSPMQSYSGVRGATSDGQRLAPFEGRQQARQMDDDALAILGEGPLRVPGEEGLNDIRVIEAAFESARSGRRIELA